MIELNTNVMGTFALKDGRVIKSILFPRDPKKVAEKLMKVEQGVCDEEKDLVSYLAETGTKEVETRDPDRFSGYRDKMRFLESLSPTSLSEIASQIGFPGKNLRDLLSETSLAITKTKMKDIGRDQMIMQSVASLDELEESINTLIKRLREWYSLHFPELDVAVKKHDLYANIVNSGFKGVDEQLTKKLMEEKKHTIGVDFKKEDLEAAKSLSNAILGLYKAQEEIESYISKAMDDTAPNIAFLAGPTLGARIISLAGGLERLSTLPASTIQVLGAEDAFFRFLKTKKKPPKHGVIFQLPEIRSAPKSIRGKISRAFAAKLAIAARADRFKGEFIGNKLRGDFLKKIEKLKA